MRFYATQMFWQTPGNEKSSSQTKKKKKISNFEILMQGIVTLSTSALLHRAKQ